MSIITLMTDFGIKDGNVGVMKGVILGIAPQTQLVDLSHVIAAQNIREAALILARSAPYFPNGTIHLVVVDPGVGTERRPVAARLGGQFYVGPDNGLITTWLEHTQAANRPAEFVHLDRPQYWLPDVSHVFHGRDIFSPSAAHLANGAALHDLGTPFSDPVRLVIPKPERRESGLLGEVIHIDHFGNAASNIRVEHVLELLQGIPALVGQDESIAAGALHFNEGSMRGRIGSILKARDYFSVRIAGEEIHGLVTTFGERAPGDLVALFGSTGNLIVSIVNGNFASRYDLKPGQPVELRLNR